DVGGVRDAILTNESGILCPDNDVKTFSENLENLILDEKLRSKMGEKGVDFVNEKYHVNRLVADVKKLYLELLNP
ncbi:MAG: glycosyltransferase family 1 protein, partial [Bacteroidetes bacterium]